MSFTLRRDLNLKPIELLAPSESTHHRKSLSPEKTKPAGKVEEKKDNNISNTATKSSHNSS